METQTLYRDWILDVSEEKILAIAPNGDVSDLAVASPLEQGKTYVDRFLLLDEIFSFLEQCSLTHQQESRLAELLGELTFSGQLVSK